MGDLKDRGKSLEEEFFARQNQKLKDKLRLNLEREQADQALALAYPNLTPAMRERFLDHGMDIEAVASLGLIPLVMVAWADGEMNDKERAAILAAAETRGVAIGSKSHTLLEEWLGHQPSPHVLEMWKEYANAAAQGLSIDEKVLLRDGILALARDVASAAGGFLGFGNKISPEEQTVLDRISQAFR